MVTTRKYDLDWLRVIAFGLLIFYHIGMYYVPWDFHVKSPYAGPFSEPAMRLLNPWRLSLLFCISGIALRFYYDKGTTGQAAFKRFLKLFIPLTFGMYVVVAPQAYFQLLASGEIQSGFWAFYEKYIEWDVGYSIATPTWNHLWYVAYLMIYSLLAALFIGPLRSLSRFMEKEWFSRLFRGGRLFIVPALLFVLYRFTLDTRFEETHGFFGDYAAHARYGSYFLIGFLLAKNERFWDLLKTGWRKIALLGLVLAVTLTVTWIHWEWVETHPVLLNTARVGRVLYAWLVIMTLFGASQAYLNRPNAWLSYLTQAVFPYYILHQTLIIVFGVWLSNHHLGAVPEFLLLLMLTVVGCALLYEYVIRPLVWLRPFFGVFGTAPPAPFTKHRRSHMK